jgi:hypothetical protein
MYGPCYPFNGCPSWIENQVGEYQGPIRHSFVTDLAFLIGGNDGQMDEETRAWYDAHRQDIIRPSSTASSSPLTSTPAGGDARFRARQGAGRDRQ